MTVVFGNDMYKITEYKFDMNKPKEYIEYLIKRQTIIHKNANERQKIYDKIREKQYNKKQKNKELEYKLNQRVLWNINSKYTGNQKKLGPKWVGPFEIIDIFNEGQSFTLKLIPLHGIDKNNPMNLINKPKRIRNKNGRNLNHELPDTFNVPRSQIKPYYDSFEQQFEGIQSPKILIMNHLNEEIPKLLKTNNLKPLELYYDRLFIMNALHFNWNYK